MKHYIDKDVLVAELNRLIAELVEEGEDTMFEQGRISAFEDVKVFINHILEVKEVDLEKEVDDYVNEYFSECDDGVLISDANSMELTLLDITPLAEHFFKLGLRAQKGE